jgi:tetratricopeptide (TPR) repeat protein
MTLNGFQFAACVLDLYKKLCRAASFALLVPLLMLASNAQDATQSVGAAQPLHAAPSELAGRIQAAEAARTAGDPAAVDATNQRLIAAALRKLAEVKRVEADYPKAVELYRRSLQYEKYPEAYPAMALAALEANDLDQAIELAKQALAAYPNDARAEKILASAYDRKGEYALAIEPLSQIVRAEPSVENQYALAECLLESGKPEDKLRAEAIFEQMKKTAGDSGSLHVLMGRAYRDGGDIHAAVREFERAIVLDPRTPHAHYFLGLMQLVLNEWNPTPAAEAEFRKEAAYFPHDYLANYMLGFVTSTQHRYEESNKYLLAAAKIFPTSPDPYLYLGLNAYSQQKMEAAETMLCKAVELTGSDEPRNNYQIRRAYVDLARILSNSGRQQESDGFAAKARVLENKTIVDSQQNVTAMMLAGGAGSSAAVMPIDRREENQSAPTAKQSDAAQAHGALSVSQHAAIEAREKSLRAVLALAYNDLATSQAIRGGFFLALDTYRQAEEWDSTLPGLEKNLGQAAFRVKNYVQAIHGLSLALQQGNDTPALRAMLGISYFATDQYTEAVRSFQPLGTSGMKDGEAGYAWAASLAHLSEMKEAAVVLTAFESEPRPNDTLLLIGQLWTEIGDYERAIATLQRALDSDPSLLKAHFDEGLTYIHWERWQDAAQAFQAELQLAPNDPDAAYHLGFVDLQQSKVDDALALFLGVIAAHPDYANAQYQAGKILLDRGQMEEAIAHLEAAARLRPQTDYMHYQLQAAYRKQGRNADADRELEIYKSLKAKSRERVADALKHNQ